MGRPPITYRTAVNPERARGGIPGSVTPGSGGMKRMGPIHKSHSNGAAALIEIDMRKGDKFFSHTLALLSPLLGGRNADSVLCKQAEFDALVFRKWGPLCLDWSARAISAMLSRGLTGVVACSAEWHMC